VKLHLLRHAKTEQFSRSGRDFDRELAEKGILQCVLLKEIFQKNNWDKTLFIISTAKRTQQTFKKSFSAIKSFKNLNELYLASAADLLSVINQQKIIADLFLIGHNEGISDLASFISGEHIHMKTAQYLCLECDVPSPEFISGNIGIIDNQFRPQA
jgi:phosphohistidine phosphatase